MLISGLFACWFYWEGGGEIGGVGNVLLWMIWGVGNVLLWMIGGDGNVLLRVIGRVGNVFCECMPVWARECCFVKGGCTLVLACLRWECVALSWRRVSVDVSGRSQMESRIHFTLCLTFHNVFDISQCVWAGLEQVLQWLKSTSFGAYRKIDLFAWQLQCETLCCRTCINVQDVCWGLCTCFRSGCALKCVC